MKTTTPHTETTRHLWAFAIDTTHRQRPAKRHQAAPERYLNRYAIMSCSPKAREIGIHTGMKLHQAKKLAPELRVIVCTSTDRT